MLKRVDHSEFQSINRGYNAVFRANRLSLGLVVPIDAYAQSSVPTMTRHVERVQLAEELDSPPSGCAMCRSMCPHLGMLARCLILSYILVF